MSEALKLSIDEKVLVRLEEAAASRGMTCEALAEGAVEHFLRAPDPYLASLSHLFEEWNTPEDAAAFDGL